MLDAGNLTIVKYEDLPGRWEERERAIENIRATGVSIHLIYDRRVTPTRRPVEENRYVIAPGVCNCCARVSIISNDGRTEVMKDRSGEGGWLEVGTENG